MKYKARWLAKNRHRCLAKARKLVNTKKQQLKI